MVITDRDSGKTKEVWESLPEYPCMFVSNLGNIRYLSGKYVNQRVGNSGYLRFTVNNRKKVYCFLTHRIVARHFIQNDSPEEKAQVNHINGDKLDNRAENLEWVTGSDNIRAFWANRGCRVVVPVVSRQASLF